MARHSCGELAGTRSNGVFVSEPRTSRSRSPVPVVSTPAMPRVTATWWEELWRSWASRTESPPPPRVPGSATKTSVPAITAAATGSTSRTPSTTGLGTRPGLTADALSTEVRAVMVARCTMVTATSSTPHATTSVAMAGSARPPGSGGAAEAIRMPAVIPSQTRYSRGVCHDGAITSDIAMRVQLSKRTRVRGSTPAPASAFWVLMIT